MNRGKPVKSACCLSFLVLMLLAMPASYAVELQSTPDFAHVYHIKRGQKLYLGQTPLKLESKDFNNNLSIKVMLHKLGYEFNTTKLKLDQNKTRLALKQKPELVVMHKDQQAGACENRTRQIIQQVMGVEKSSPGIYLSSPVEINTDSNIIRLETRMIDQSRVKKLKSYKRKKQVDKIDRALKQAHEKLIGHLQQSLAKQSCVTGIELIAYIGMETKKLVRAPYLKKYNMAVTNSWTDYTTGVKTTTTTFFTKSEYDYENKIRNQKENYYRRFLFKL